MIGFTARRGRRWGGDTARRLRSPPAENPPGICHLGTFSDLASPADFRRFADRVRELTGGISIAFKLFANHIEDDIDFTQDRRDVTLIITAGLPVANDFVKSLCMGADGIALSNSAMQAIGCVAARMCNSNNCPVGVATQEPELRALLDLEKSASQPTRFFEASVELMQVLARACGHDHLSEFNLGDMTTRKKDLADLSGVESAGYDPSR